MREILFRGKRFSSENGWYYGDLYHRNEEVLINNYYEGFNVSVIPETVGQYTGLTDKNGKKIFEGDIVAYARDEEVGQIEYHESEAMFVVVFDTWLTDFDHMYDKDLEVIGNIHDNPELLEEAENALKERERV